MSVKRDPDRVNIKHTNRYVICPPGPITCCSWPILTGVYIRALMMQMLTGVNIYALVTLVVQRWTAAKGINAGSRTYPTSAALMAIKLSSDLTIGLRSKFEPDR